MRLFDAPTYLADDTASVSECDFMADSRQYVLEEVARRCVLYSRGLLTRSMGENTLGAAAFGAIWSMLLRRC